MSQEGREAEVVRLEAELAQVREERDHNARTAVELDRQLAQARENACPTDPIFACPRETEANHRRVQELQEAVEGEAYARPESPSEVWLELLAKVAQVREERDRIKTDIAWLIGAHYYPDLSQAPNFLRRYLPDAALTEETK